MVVVNISYVLLSSLSVYILVAIFSRYRAPKGGHINIIDLYMCQPIPTSKKIHMHSSTTIVLITCCGCAKAISTVHHPLFVLFILIINPPYPTQITLCHGCHIHMMFVLRTLFYFCVDNYYDCKIIFDNIII